jgi:hypothetical protein
MKIIFLDFDGVLNSQYWYTKRMGEFTMDDFGSKYPIYEFDPETIERLNYIIEKTSAKVVVSSTWRIGKNVEYLQNLLVSVGFNGEIIDKTPSFFC